MIVTCKAVLKVSRARTPTVYWKGGHLCSVFLIFAIALNGQWFYPCKETKKLWFGRQEVECFRVVLCLKANWKVIEIQTFRP